MQPNKSEIKELVRTFWDNPHHDYDAAPAHGVNSKAKDKAAALKIKANFEVQDAETLSFPDNTFDAVVSRHVIWTLADPLTAARDWTRVVRPQGKVIADIPQMKSH